MEENLIEEIKYNITNHAQERYTERMTGRDNMTDIRIYINNHKDDINGRINKLINYGEMIYEGKIKDHPITEVYYKDLWIILVDPKTKNVITLYKINLGDDEVSNLFALRTIARIKAEQDRLDDLECQAENQRLEYQELINQNNIEINYYKKSIKSLEENNDCFKILMKNSNSAIEKKKKEIKDQVETLVAGRKF